MQYMVCEMLVAVMARAETMVDFSPRPRVLVIDDHYAVESRGEEISHYDKTCFLEDHHSDRFDFLFFSGFDTPTRRYTLASVQQYIASLDTLPSAVLLDVMFGDEGLLGLDILKWFNAEHPLLPVVMMTSKQKGELFEEAVRFGAVDYLVKPLERNELHETLFRYLPENRESLLIGQDDEFLLIATKLAQAEGNILIQSDDKLRAGHLLEYSARVNDKGLHEINLDPEVGLEDVTVSKGSLNVLVGLERLSLDMQESLATMVEQYYGKIQFATVGSLHVARHIKRHELSGRLYTTLSTTSIVLPRIVTTGNDLFLLFRHYFNLQKPAHINADLNLSSGCLQEAFANQSGVTVAEIREFISGLFRQCSTITDDILIAFSMEHSETDFPDRSYDDLRERLDALREEEFALLLKALYRTIKPGKRANKSLAISRLLNKEKASTNEYDRWIKKVWKELPPSKQASCRRSGQIEQLGIKL